MLLISKIEVEIIKPVIARLKEDMEIIKRELMNYIFSN